MSTISIILIFSLFGLLICLNPFRAKPSYGRRELRTTIKNTGWMK